MGEGPPDRVAPPFSFEANLSSVDSLVPLHREGDDGRRAGRLANEAGAGWGLRLHGQRRCDDVAVAAVVFAVQNVRTTVCTRCDRTCDGQRVATRAGDIGATHYERGGREVRGPVAVVVEL